MPYLLAGICGFLGAEDPFHTGDRTHVWYTLAEARRAARKEALPLVVFVPEDETRFQAALDFLQSVDGAKARGRMELWLSRPGDPATLRLMEELGLNSLPVLASLAGSGKQTLDCFLGEDCVPIAKAFDNLLKAKPIPPSWLQDWVGPGRSTEPFTAFAEARRQDLGAAAREPHRTWLMGLLKGKDDRLRNWAATRLFEGNAVVAPGEPPPFPVLIRLLEERFNKEVRTGNTASLKAGGGSQAHPFEGNPNPPLANLGQPGRISSKAPVWAMVRNYILALPAGPLPLPLYVLMAPELQDTDRAWIRQLLAKEATASTHMDALHSPLYWLATDWLILYGTPEDWAFCQKAIAPMKWDWAFSKLQSELKRVPGFWDSKPELQAMFCEGVTYETFWEHPDSCLASWGVSREALVEFGVDRMKAKTTPNHPAYPELARRMGFSATLRLRMLVGPDGTTRWARPEPGYALALFAPAGLAFAMGWTFEPARVAGVPRPSQFSLTMPFILPH